MTLCSEGVEVLKFLNAEEALTGLNPDIGGLLRELILLSAPPGEENIFLPSAVRGPGNILSISIEKEKKTVDTYKLMLAVGLEQKTKYFLD